MSDLIDFGRIEWGDPAYTEDQWIAAEFLSKMDWEGGLDGLMNYGGPGVFPEELYDLAVAYKTAYDALKDGINRWAAERGVVY